MGKNRGQRRSKQRSETKQKHGSKNYGVNKWTATDALSHAFSSGWVQNSAIALGLALISLVVVLMTSTGTKAAALAFACTGTLAIWILAAVVIKSVDSEKGLVIDVHTVMPSNDRASLCFWLRYATHAPGDTISPLPIVLYLSITNTRDKPITLDTIALSIRTAHGKWVKLRHVNATLGDLYWMDGGDLTNASLLGFDGLDELLANRPISPHVPIAGWIFFEVEVPVPFISGDITGYKWRVSDTIGEEFEMVSKSSAIQHQPSEAIARASFTIRAPHLNLGKLNIKEKRWNIWP